MEQATSAPPASNTGALTQISRSVDWVGFTFPTDIPLQGVKEIMGLEDWQEMDRGGMGYSASCRRGHVAIYYEGRANMGIHVEITGQGCREEEASGRVKDWRGFFGRLLEFGCKFTRVDIAHDDRSGWLNLDTIGEAVKAREFTTRFRRGQEVHGWAYDEKKDGGRCFYFGSAASLACIRIYDKAREQGLPAAEHWIRVEQVFRDERAQRMVQECVANGFDVCAGVLRNYLEFKEAQENVRRDLRKPAAWWLAFLGGVEKAHLSMAKLARTLEQVKEWLERQVTPAVALMLEWKRGPEWFVGQMELAKFRWKKEHLAMLRAANAAAGP
ncbi:MAG: replication initiation factor domain-containing protein [Armatimonadetes bacterium]|nr:replication initiation factor domain-containing protein [Armatimonadota bacterium]